MKEALNSKSWLNENDDPLPELLRHWDMTFCLREIDIKNQSFIDSESLIEQWPVLKKSCIQELVSFFSFTKM